MLKLSEWYYDHGAWVWFGLLLAYLVLTSIDVWTGTGIADPLLVCFGAIYLPILLGRKMLYWQEINLERKILRQFNLEDGAGEDE